ncbi:MAG: hypothetical protein IPG53_11110 [Ignavibacteriales bacterium]|nr:hypothetical protein [Ignavibacteriales bacterium]
MISLVRPSYTAFFESAIVPLCSFIMNNSNVKSAEATYFDLDYLGNAEEQVPRLMDGINNPDSKRICAKAIQFLKNPRVAYGLLGK